VPAAEHATRPATLPGKPDGVSTYRARSSSGAWASLAPSSRSAQATSAASFPPRLAPSGWCAPAETLATAATRPDAVCDDLVDDVLRRTLRAGGHRHGVSRLAKREPLQVTGERGVNGACLPRVAPRTDPSNARS
jgi:hypothetical protein